MKKILKYTLLAVLSALVLAGCNDWLDDLPDNRTELDNAQKISQLLVSAYPTGSTILMAEMSSDNIMDNGNLYSVDYEITRETYLWEEIKQVDQDSPYYVWNTHYKSIAATNEAIKFIEDNGSPEEYNGYLAEALLCRAYCHFAMANIFCQHYSDSTASLDLGIPYVEDIETVVYKDYDRGTVKDVYEKINRDIERALPLVSEDHMSVPAYRFNRKASYAFAARFNLYYGKDMQKVVDYATAALGDDPTSMLRNWDALKAANDYSDKARLYISPEQSCNFLLMPTQTVWTRVYGPYRSAMRYTHNREKASGETVWSTGFWEYQAEYPFYSMYGGTVQKSCYCKMDEYFVVTDPVNATGQINMVQVIFNANELLLCRAEAYARLKRYDKALEDLTYWMNNYKTSGVLSMADLNALYGPGVPYGNTVKKRINPLFEIEYGGDMETILHAVLHARRIESIHEGLRWYDVKRYGIEISHNRFELSPLTLTRRDNRIAIQLPADVIMAGLLANPR